MIDSSYVVNSVTAEDGNYDTVKVCVVFSVTAEDENNDTVKVCVVLPGLTKKFGKNKAKNGSVEVDFNHR